MMGISIRQSGVWKESEPYVRHAGVWKPVQQGFVRDAGTWKEFYAGGFDPLNPPPIGTFVESEGGYYIGNITYADSRTFALFTPNKAEGQDNSIQWKTTNDGTSNTGDDDDGWANLQGMIAAGISSHPMGDWCNDLVINGKNDWYPPARNELTVMHDARGSIAGADSIDTDTTYYWTSTEHPSNTNDAWLRRFSDGFENYLSKLNSYRVRAVRRLAI